MGISIGLLRYPAFLSTANEDADSTARVVLANGGCCD